MSEEIKSLKEYISTTKNEIFTTFKIETISNLIIYYEELEQKVEQSVLEIEQLRTELNNKNNIINELKKDTQNKTKYINYIDDVASKYKSRIDKALSWTNRIIEIIKQQPSEDDTWILENLHSIKCLLQGSDKNEKMDIN